MKSDLLGTLSSTPNKRGLKTTFTNIVSLLKSMMNLTFQ